MSSSRFLEDNGIISKCIFQYRPAVSITACSEALNCNMTDPDSPKAQELFSNVFHVSAGDRGPMYYCQQWGREFGIQKQPLPDLKKIPEFFPNFDFPVPSSDIEDKNTIASNKSGNSKTSGSGFEQNTQIGFCFPSLCSPCRPAT